MTVLPEDLDTSALRMGDDPEADDLTGDDPGGNELADWLVGGGNMGRLIRSMDWSKTPLGPIDSWPQSLRTTVRLCLASNFPISLAWGPQHVQIYNDGYWPICGEKHPQSMGQDFTECWASAWPVIGEAFARACADETSFLENQRMFLDRNGYLEETFFTFSFSPIRDDTGVAGLFHPVTETTALMLSERRTRVLRDLTAPEEQAKTIERTCTSAAKTLSASTLDLPFVLFYLFDEKGEQARLVAGAGLTEVSLASPALVDLALADKLTWPLGKVLRSGLAKHVRNLETRFGHFSCGEYPESQEEALALPITPPGCTRPIGVLVAGVSTRLPLDETYRTFYDLLAAAVTAQVANARAQEAERKRAQALAEIDHAKTVFFSNVSHEFRTPLTLMLGLLEDELAERNQPLPPARRERLETALRNSLRLLKLVNTLLDFTRIEAGRMDAIYQPTDLATYTAELASMFRAAVEKAGLTLDIDCPPLPETIYVDREMWEKIVLNLLSNAFKHTFDGAIAVTLRWCGDHAELEVADTGVGIPEVELPRLFERFHRVRGTKSRTHEGTGIGLALVRELVLLHGGTVHVASEEGKGSRFMATIKAGCAHLPPERLGASRVLASTKAPSEVYVAEALQWLPDTKSEDNKAPQWSVAFASPEKSAAMGVRRPRILLADDNADMRNYLNRLLSERYDVVSVSDGTAAFAAALEAPPDLILSDVMMPSLDGMGLLRALRATPQTRGIPVVLLTARADEESAIEGLNAGADDYLAKPFSAKELLARVRSQLEPSLIHKEWEDTLEQSNKDLESFNYSVSHDLRAPLRAIDGFSKALLDECGGKLDSQGFRHLHRIRVGTRKMSSIIDDLLTLSKVGRGEPRRERIDLSEIARQALEELRILDPARKVVVTVEEGLTAIADERLVSIALVNLLGNAWKYTSKRTEARICFAGQRQGDETVFFVRDNGVGFDLAQADKLFMPFHRLHRDSEFEGTGIGLATVQRVVSRHGGRIWAESIVDAGATFYFTLEGGQQ